MKKIVALLAFSVIFNMVIKAQGDINFGFQLSPYVSWMTTSSTKINPSGSNMGLKLGMIGEYYFRENYAFSSGIGFSFNNGGTLLHEIGGSYWTRSELSADLDTLPNNVKLKYNLQYLEIPLALKMRTKEFGYLRYFIEPAITLGFKTQARGSIMGAGVGEDVEKIDIRKEVNGLNMSWGIGAGAEYSLSESTRLVAGVAFQIGFSDITDDNGVVFDPNRKWPDQTPEENSKGTIKSIVLKMGIIF